eukprot:14545984-Alexandrium_andersonii.AAC.1
MRCTSFLGCWCQSGAREVTLVLFFFASAQGHEVACLEAPPCGNPCFRRQQGPGSSPFGPKE